MPKGNDRNSGYERDPDDWYVEDVPCVRSLFTAMPSIAANGAHDPCCGKGNIPRVAESLGIAMTGADKIDRADGLYPVRSFLEDQTRYPAIITNPPFSLSAQIVRHALRTVVDGGYVAIVAQARFLYSQGRHTLFTMPECERVLIMSKRPSMPPGKQLEIEGEACRKNGSVDYCWIVWRVGKTEPGATIGWLP